MKRKSIFLTIVAVLVASLAWGQTLTPTWKDGSNASVTPDPANENADTIYFCASLDSLYPIELGYDVAGKRLSPEFGEWSLYATTPGVSLVEPDYAFGVAKNDGAGNAFKVVGSGIGGYIFRYVSADNQCGLNKDEIFLSYVFVLPDSSNVIEDDSIRCVEKTKFSPSTKRPDIDFSTYFKSVLDLYTTAGFTTSWKSTGKFNDVPTDSIGIYSYQDTLILKKVHPSLSNYTCGLKIVFKFSLTVVKDVNEFVKGTGYSACASDTVGAGKNESPGKYFDHGYPGTFEPATIGAASGTTPGGVVSEWKTIGTTKVGYRVFEFKYKDCQPSEKYVYDTLYLRDTGKGNWGTASVTICREPGDKSIFYFYDQANYGNGRWDLTETSSAWKDWGTSGLGATTIKYGTISGGPSLKGYTVLVDSLKSSLKYNYEWRASGIECAFTKDASGNLHPDSGLLVVSIQDPVIAQDYTAQLCKVSYGTDSFDLAKYTGVTEQWRAYSNDAVVPKNKVKVATLFAPSTQKYYYELAPLCGSGGKGVFYLKIAPTIKIAKSKTVSYCSDRLPASINLNDVLNITVKGITWAYDGDSGAGGPSGAFGLSADGIIDVAEFTKKYGEVNTYIFTLSTTSVIGGSCGVTDATKLKIVFGPTVFN
jgi:hypothetical protein